MKKLFTPFNILLTTLGAGIVGFLLQLWLIRSTIDERGLLRSGHISAIAGFVLTAAVVVVLFLYVRQHKPISSYNGLIAGGLFPALGSFAAAGGILYTVIPTVLEKPDVLDWIVLILGTAAAACLVAVGLFRLLKKRPHALYQGIVSLFLAVFLLYQYRIWCKEPQLVVFFFPIMACICVMLAVHHGSVLDAQKDSCRRYIFFNRAALFSCCLALCHGSPVFFATMALYMACSLRLFPTAAKRRTTDSAE